MAATEYEERVPDALADHLSSTTGGGVRGLRAPAEPTAEEWQRHLVDHTPFRAWCPSCVVGRGKAEAHRRHAHVDVGVDIVACDYAFLSAGPTAAEAGDEASEQGLPALVHKLYGDRWVTAHVVPRKGPDPWAVRVAASDL